MDLILVTIKAKIDFKHMELIFIIKIFIIDFIKSIFIIY